jgi:DNA-binding MarR family transcriptional regulator
LENKQNDLDGLEHSIDSPGTEALKRFRLIFKAVQQHAQWLEKTCGLSNAQLWALWEISQNPGMRPTELAKAMSIHQSTASNLLEKMAKKGLVKRERISEDQRVVSLFLADPGRNILASAPMPARGILQDALFALPNSTLISLSESLDELIKAMGIEVADAAMEPLVAPAKPRGKVDASFSPN